MLGYLFPNFFFVLKLHVWCSLFYSLPIRAKGNQHLESNRLGFFFLLKCGSESIEPLLSTHVRKHTHTHAPSACSVRGSHVRVASIVPSEESQFSSPLPILLSCSSLQLHIGFQIKIIALRTTEKRGTGEDGEESGGGGCRW